MNVSRFSVHRPIFTIMIVLIVAILGGISLARLPIDLMPDISYPTLTVSCGYGNAAPEEMEQLVTRPIEEAMSAVPGVEEVSSTSSEGRSSVRVSFAWGTDLDAAANDVRDRLDRVIPRLPDEADRPSLRKADLAAFPILILGACSDLDPLQMRRVIDEQVKYRLERLPGVASLDIWGGLEREIHVNLDPDKVNALSISLDQVVRQIRQANVDMPAGTVERGSYEIVIRTPGQYGDLDELRRTAVAVRDGKPIRLSEIAQVTDSWRKVRNIVRVNGRPGIRLSINKQSGRNTVEVARGVLAELRRIRQDLPQIEIIPIVDSSDYIRRSITNVGSAAVYGGLLAVAVLLVFLRNIRSTVIIAASLPISIVATFALMYFGGLTLNIMTLGGLALGVGMLVDNAIVVLENICRLREDGRLPHEAAVSGSEEVTSAIIASTATTVVVFLPLVFMRGMSGVMFKQLSAVVGFSLVCSLAAALTVVPMLSARLLPAGGSSRPAWLNRAFDLSGAMLRAIEDGYRKVLHVAMGNRASVIVLAAALLAGSVFIVKLVGSELMPQTDEGEVRITGEMEVGTRADVVAEKFEHIEAVVKQAVSDDAVSTVASMGANTFRGGASSQGDLRIALTSRSQRSRSDEDVAADLRKTLSGIPGMTIRVRTGGGLVQRLSRMGTSSAERVQVEIRGHDLVVADALAGEVRKAIESVRGVTDVQLSREAGTPEESIVVDREKAADLGLTVSDVANAVKTALAGTEASSFRQAGDEFPIVVKLSEPSKVKLRDILDLTVANAAGEAVVLRNVVQVQSRTGPVQIERKNQQRLMNVRANISGRDLGSVLADAREALQAVPVPEGFSIVFGGDYDEQRQAFRELLISCGLALLLVYMVMACQYESLRDPFIVMFSVPLAVIGVVAMLYVTKTTFNVQSYIGCIMLAGIVVNNAILLVDQTNLLRRRDGMELGAAIEQAARRRLRPILMTACTTIGGLTPLAMGMGEAGEAQAPMARAVIGGLTSSTIITLVIVPVMYSLLARRKPPAHGQAAKQAPADVSLEAGHA